MNIAIVTQPIEKNFGGVLQNFALQSVLKKMGHSPITIDFRDNMPLYYYILVLIKSALMWAIPSKSKSLPPYRNVTHRDLRVSKFIDKNMTMTAKQYFHYTPKAIIENKCNAIIVGSDQVWRPRYNPTCLYDMFLDFARSLKVKKIAYAASFGTAKWEYSEKQTKKCTNLIKQFNDVSIRESSGVELCLKYLHREAQEVLDPTLLLSKQDYIAVCSDIPKSKENFICAYILGKDGKALNAARNFANRKHVKLKVLLAEQAISCSIEEWLASFRDATYVITDSFHGTVFSIIFQKPFHTLVNHSRGSARFDSLLGKFGLSAHASPNIPNEINPIDWNSVEKKRSELVNNSYNFIRKGLS